MRITKELEGYANFVTDAGLSSNFGIGSGGVVQVEDEYHAVIYGIGTRDVPAVIQAHLESKAIQMDAFGASGWGRPPAFAMTVLVTDAEIVELRTFLAGLG